MKRMLALLVLLAGCLGPSDVDVTEITVDFGGKLQDASSGAGVSGIHLAIVQLDSLLAAGLQPSLMTDTSLTTGEFAARMHLGRPRSSCDNRNQPLVVTLRFTDPRNRYQQTDSHQSLCRYTLAELLQATSLIVELTSR